jgi:probable HAF family extracellular repeat protein
MWQNGEISNLGAVGDDVLSSASSINNRGDVVGYSITTSFASRAFRWQKGVMIDLNTLIPANSGWVLLGRHTSMTQDKSWATACSTATCTRSC